MIHVQVGGAAGWESDEKLTKRRAQRDEEEHDD